MTPEELAYAATLPPGVTYLTSQNIHNSKEANEAYRRTSDETNARYRALCKELEDETPTPVDPEEGVAEVFRSTCPNCYTKLVSQPRGGVKCPKCSYWFCF